MTKPLPEIAEIKRLHKKYAPNEKVYELVYGHCQIVCEIALWCADNLANDVKLNTDLLKASCLLHDIGSYAFFDENGKVTNERLYPQHAILGARILEDEGFGKKIVDTVSTHVLLGLSKQEIIDIPWYLPERDYMPTSLEGELLCYADRFHSKHPTFNTYDTFLAKLKRSLPLQAERFELWRERFGLPDVPRLAEKYNQPIR
ncbi:MAG: HD domain-containing protein [Candidatus Saccharimonadales bacterium]